MYNGMRQSILGTASADIGGRAAFVAFSSRRSSPDPSIFTTTIHCAVVNIEHERVGDMQNTLYLFNYLIIYLIDY